MYNFGCLFCLLNETMSIDVEMKEQINIANRKCSESFGEGLGSDKKGLELGFYCRIGAYSHLYRVSWNMWEISRIQIKH